MFAVTGAKRHRFCVLPVRLKVLYFRLLVRYMGFFVTKAARTKIPRFVAVVLLVALKPANLIPTIPTETLNISVRGVINDFRISCRVT